MHRPRPWLPVVARRVAGSWLLCWAAAGCVDPKFNTKSDTREARRIPSGPSVVTTGGSNTNGPSVATGGSNTNGPSVATGGSNIGLSKGAGGWLADAAIPSSAAGSDWPPTNASAARKGVAAPVDRAMLISVDGLGANHLITQFGRGKLPGFAALRRAGASTLNARTDFAYTLTLPNHTSMLTGRPVTRDPALPDDVFHGWTGNSLVDAAYTLHNSGNPKVAYLASIFDVAHDHGKRTCMYAGKSKFSLYSNSYDAKNGAPDTVGDDDGRNKLDRVVIIENDTESLISTIERDFVAGTCDLAFIHIADLDALGHVSQWGSSVWYGALDRVDGWIARLAKFTESSETRKPWGLVLTADHGGLPEGHSDPTDSWNYQIPFFVVAPHVSPDSDLYALAISSRIDPGRERPKTSGPDQPIRNGDAANVIMALFGLPPVPGSFMRGLLAAQ